MQVETNSNSPKFLSLNLNVKDQNIRFKKWLFPVFSKHWPRFKIFRMRIDCKKQIEVIEYYSVYYLLE